MKKTVRLFLLWLLLLVVIRAFTLKTRLQLSTAGHELVQIGIVVVTCWLAWRWVIYDEMSDLRESRNSEPVRYHYRNAAFVEDVEALPAEQIRQPWSG